MISFDKIVNKLLKRCGTILFKEDIYELLDPEKKPAYQSSVDKTIYRLKAEGVIIGLKAGVYIIPDSEDIQLNEIDLIDKYYLKLLKRYITHLVGNQYYISGKKALQIHLKDFSIPDKIYIVNRSLDKKIFIGNYCIIFKTVAGKEFGKKINLYTKLSEFIQTMRIDGRDFKIAGLELSLVEATMITDENGVDIQLLNKCIKKYAKFLKKDIFKELGKYKFVMSMNRLKEISRPIDASLSLCFLDIIKQNGGLFIGEGLRGF